MRGLRRVGRRTSSPRRPSAPPQPTLAPPSPPAHLPRFSSQMFPSTRRTCHIPRTSSARLPRNPTRRHRLCSPTHRQSNARRATAPHLHTPLRRHRKGRPAAEPLHRKAQVLTRRRRHQTPRNAQPQRLPATRQRVRPVPIDTAARHSSTSSDNRAQTRRQQHPRPGTQVSKRHRPPGRQYSSRATTQARRLVPRVRRPRRR
jgi:hypothetical protein